ncbi:MAG: hypothetical protein ACNS60_03490 [Candidatus Cyclobacteriaceae bacterium M2_1C_046]
MNYNISTCVDEICSFAKTYRTANLTPFEILNRSNYITVHEYITVTLIANYLRTNPHLINDWDLFCQDIRHTPAWSYRLTNNKWVVELANNNDKIEQFAYNDKIEACAKLIKMTANQIMSNK